MRERRGTEMDGKPRTRRWAWGAWATAVIALLAWGVSPPTGISAPDAVGEVAPAPTATPALLARGEALYRAQCAACHGETGRGDGKAAYLLYPKPRDFTQVRFRLVSTVNRVPSDDDLYRSISRGMPGSAMPPWEHLSSSDRWGLVYFVRKLTREGKAARLVEDGVDPKKAAEVAEQLTTPGASVEFSAEPAVTPESLARGKQLYLEACASCHDADGRGRNKRDLKDDNEFPLFARDFTKGIFKGGSTGVDLARRFIAGLPGTPMPSFAQNLGNGADLWSVIHYVQSMVPSGAQEKVEQHARTLKMTRVLDEQIADPHSPAWAKATAVVLPLMPLWWRDERVEDVEVRALRNAGKVAIRLSWADVTKEDETLRQTAFGDGAAIQFSLSLDPPFFGMGEKDKPVNIWSWKAHWEADVAAYRDVQDAHPDMAVDWYDSLQDPPKGRHSPVGEYPTSQHNPTFLTGWGAGNVVSDPRRVSSVEDLTAQGFSTLTNQGKGAQNVQGKARWEDGRWTIVFVREPSAGDAGDIIFRAGEALSIAFAVWDGAAGERNGQKSVTIWHRLQIEE